MLMAVTLLPRTSFAQLPVTDAANLVPNSATAVANTAQAAGTAPKNILDALAWSVAKMTVQSITRSMVTWINTGFQGSPAFVSDLNENLRYLGDAVAEDFFRRADQSVIAATGFSVRSPFQDQINAKLREEYYRTTSSWGLNQFNMGTYSTDPKAFIMEGRFSQGGFNAFFATSQNQANNPYGAYLRASNQLAAEIDAAAARRKAELNWGRGFLPWRGNCTPASGAPVVLSRSERCLFDPVKTPGAMVEQSLGITINSPLRQLELADSVNEIVAALVGQMMNQVLGGVGLSGLSQPTAGGGPSFLDQASSATAYAATNASLSNGILNNLANDERLVIEFRDQWGSIAQAATAAQAKCGVSNSEINAARTRAANGVAQAGRALSEIAVIKQKVATTQSTASTTNAAMQISTTVTDYQSFIQNSSVPSLEQYAEASRESTYQEDSRTLFTRMTELQKDCDS